ncbi:hypothetical protein QBC42DRAFT_313416 [Cladorrhinum samala]|uniref:Uncharacterized protein n=1 Tax=Cladorrhinum samala TaxID=585594 RepID=A0AAV9HDR0_9PEZI|nr:hypothetical protein QBC42DRAFT_313416 [Cladorrhinum samala]
MSTNTNPPRQQAARLTGRRRSSILRTSLDQLQPGGRRRSSTIRKYARNIENFNRNRATNAVRERNDVGVPFPSRMRTRSMARADEEDDPTQRQQTEVRRRWQPSIVIGSPLWLDGEDPSKIEMADRKVAQTRLWAEHYQGVAGFAEMHQEAVRERAHLDEKDEANTKPRSSVAALQTAAVNKRIRLLQNLLGDCEFGPERENIEAAKAGYESGDIPYSESYTIIWAGRIVDRMPDYETFTADREALLDRYASEHGPGWLWYEPPLSGTSSSPMRGPTILAKRGTSLINEHRFRCNTENMGHYHIEMGFQRRKELVTRRALSSDLGYPSKPSKVTTEADSTGPIVYYQTLLDSGATLPFIYSADLVCLNIDKRSYAAQSAKAVSTASAVISMRTYDMSVSVYPFPEPAQSSTAAKSRVPQIHYEAYNAATYPPPSPGPPTWPSEPSVMSLVLPVVVSAGSAAADFDASQPPDRLSGLAPFHLVYLASTPGQNKLHLGEDRRDVLGSLRMPGQKRYKTEDIYSKTPERKRHLTTQMDAGHPAWLHERVVAEQPRRIIFEHDFVDGTGRVLRDEDGDDRHGVGGRSVLVVGPKGTAFDDLKAHGGGVQGVEVIEIEPRRLESQQKALEDWKRANGLEVNKSPKANGKGKRTATENDDIAEEEPSTWSSWL